MRQIRAWHYVETHQRRRQPRGCPTSSFQQL